MHVKLYEDGQGPKDSGSVLFLKTLWFICVWALLIGLVVTYFRNSDSYKFFIWGCIATTALQFVATTIQIIRLRRGFWFIFASLLFYALIVGEFFILNHYNPEPRKNSFIAFVTFLVLSYIIEFIQLKAEKRKVAKIEA